MKNQRLFHLISIAVIFVFIVSLFTTVNVLADDGTPPVPTEEPAQPPTEESTPEETPSEEPSEEAEPASTSIPETEETDEPETPAEILEAAPQGVDVVVLDENGNALPLTTEEAADIILTGDPIWCLDDLDGTPQDNPVANTNGCTDSYSNFADLITDLASGVYDGILGDGNGTIFVENNYVASEGEIFIDHTNGSLVSLNNLTIQGGWVPGTGVNTSLQSTLDGTWLSIYNWVGSVTINNLFIQNAASDGLYIQTTGDVNLNDVDVDNSDLSGAWIESGSNVTVMNSSFTNNGEEGYYDDYASGGQYDQYYEASPGLWVSTSGNVTLNNIYAYHNGGDGATIFGNNVEVTDSIFEDNGWGQNDGAGAYLEYHESDNGIDAFEAWESFHGGNGLTVTASGDITITDICVCGNAGHGADLDADGDIRISDSSFIYNGGFGFAYLYHYAYDDGSVFSGNFSLEYEAGSGLIASADGDIELHNVTADHNANSGAELYSESGNVLINELGEYSTFDYNGSGRGIFDYEYCDNVYCGYDDLEYYLVDGFCDDIVYFGSTFFNPCEDNEYIEVQAPNFDYNVNYQATAESSYSSYYIQQNGGIGLEAEADSGSVTLRNLDVYQNGGYGAYIYGNDGVSIDNSVFEENGLLGSLELSECWSNGELEEYNGCIYNSEITIDNASTLSLEFDYGDGLHVDSDGTITLRQVQAIYNANNGALLHGDLSVFVENSDFSHNTNEPIYLGGEGGLFGLFLYDEFGIDSSIVIPGSEFDFNVSIFEGVEDETGFSLGMSISSGDGLQIETDSNITLQGISVEDNAGDGAKLYSDDGSINITNSIFNDNGFGSNGYMFAENLSSGEYEGQFYETYMSNGSGLYADAYGAITLTNVAANSNALYGAKLETDSDVFVEESEFSGNGWYGYGSYEYNSTYGYYDEDLGEFIYLVDEEDEDEWYGSGLYIDAGGNVRLTRVTANENDQDGAEVYSNGGRVIVICGQYNENGEYGIYENGASSLELYDTEISGNGASPDEYYFSGNLILSDDCVIPEEKGGESEIIKNKTLSVICQGLATNATFALPSGDFAVFPCPINDSAFIQSITKDELPSGLADGQKFLSALKTHLTKDGSSVDENDRSMKISFLIPEGVDKETLAILYWNGTEWMDLGGEVSADGLYFEISTNFVGTFVLVSK